MDELVEATRVFVDKRRRSGGGAAAPRRAAAAPERLS
jgi:hypothetical protein